MAFSSAAFFNSMTASGRPLTNSTMSGRRVCWPSATVNWLTASQSLLSGIVEIDDPRLRPGDRAVGASIFDRDAIHQHAVDGAVALHQRRRIEPDQLAEGVVECLGWQVGIEPPRAPAAAAFKDDVAVVRVSALGRRTHPTAMSGPWAAPAAHSVQPRERGLFDHRLVKPVTPAPIPASIPDADKIQAGCPSSVQ